MLPGLFIVGCVLLGLVGALPRAREPSLGRNFDHLVILDISC